MQISMQNPYKVMAGFINTSLQNTDKNQISLAIKAVLHPNPLVTLALIKASTNILYSFVIFTIT